MLEKTIKYVLQKKANEWIKSIKDDAVAGLVKRDLIITGGCIVSMMQNEEPNDYDCYFKTKETVLAVANYYAKIWNETHSKGEYQSVAVIDADSEAKEEGEDRTGIHAPGRVSMFFRSSGVGRDDSCEEPASETDDTHEAKSQNNSKEYKPVFITSNAITLSDNIQVVIRFYGSPEEIHDTYDFVHTKGYYDLFSNKISIPSDVYEAVLNKTLIYTGSRYPVCSMFRVRKFIERGWHINAGQILKMCMQVSDLDLYDVDTLEDQLIGVDSAFFSMIIKDIREEHKKTGKPISQSYLLTLIDTIF